MSPLGMTRFTREVSRRASGWLLSVAAHFKDETPEKRGSGAGLGQRPRAGGLGLGIQEGGCPEVLPARARHGQLDREGQWAMPERGPLGSWGPADGLRTGRSSENRWAVGP